MVKEIKIGNCQNHQCWEQRNVDSPSMKLPPWHRKSTPGMIDGTDPSPFPTPCKELSINSFPQTAAWGNMTTSSQSDRRSLTSWPCLCFLLLMMYRHRTHSGVSQSNTVKKMRGQTTVLWISRCFLTLSCHDIQIWDLNRNLKKKKRSELCSSSTKQNTWGFFHTWQFMS